MAWLRAAVRRLSGAIDAPPIPEPVAPAIPWKTQGNAALQAGDAAEAARCYEQGVLAQPGDASLRLNLGFALLERGDLRQAADRLTQALALRRPADGFAHEAHYLLGRAQGGLGQSDAALSSFRAAVAANPDFAEPLEEIARLLHQQGRHAEAADAARRLVALRPSAFARLLLANQLVLARAEADAVGVLAGLCADEPGNIDALVLRFDALMKLGRVDEALVDAQKVLDLAGPDPGALVNVAVALEKLGRLDEALAHLDDALKRDPARLDASINRVAVLTEQGRPRDAVAAARAALAIHPESADLHWNLSIAHLLLGEFEQGWKEHEWRARSGAFRGSMPDLGLPRWTGEDLAGRTIFLYGEQGFGDNIQFVRYVPDIARRAGTVLLQVPAALEPLMRDLAPNCRLLPQGALLPPADFHCPLMSLPAVLGTTLDTIPAEAPYLAADPAAVQRWRDRMGDRALNVGLAWSGKPTHVNDHNRSTTLQAFRALQVEGVQFVTVQPQLRAEDRATLEQWPQVIDLGRELRDFADTAALVGALDLVISVDTGVAHLAGALAKPVWVLLPHAPDWRWMLERRDSPWYPSARLYRQAAARGWAPLLAEVKEDLAARAAQR